MSTDKGATSRTFYQGSSPNEKSSTEDSVRILERSECHEEYFERLSTLDDALHDSIRSPQSIIFTSTSAVNIWVNKGHEDFFPAEFRFMMSRNLNGSFGCEYYRDKDEKIVACEDVWSLFKMKHVWRSPDSLKIYEGWVQLALFVRQDWITSKQLITCLDWPEYLTQQLPAFLPKIHKGDPYAWQAMFVSEMRKIYDQAIWDLRGVVWDIEAVCDQRYI
ncbi:hypothetical protein N7490_007779 [Penicillium lividum]|nr:hypothetical protein N7490_007779 [Penicillium lividum]